MNHVPDEVVLKQHTSNSAECILCWFNTDIMANMATARELSSEEREELLRTLKKRYEENMSRHKSLVWSEVEAKLRSMACTEKLWSLNEMERTGGEPDVVGFDMGAGEYIFFDCSPESPAGRRNICYDRQAMVSRKSFPPDNNAEEMAADMGIVLLTEEQYRVLQDFGDFDMKTSSWIKTPDNIRKLGGALFADRRYGTVFIYHNGASSYYAARGFRGSVRV